MSPVDPAMHAKLPRTEPLQALPSATPRVPPGLALPLVFLPDLEPGNIWIHLKHLRGKHYVKTWTVLDSTVTKSLGKWTHMNSVASHHTSAHAWTQWTHIVSFWKKTSCSVFSSPFMETPTPHRHLVGENANVKHSWSCSESQTRTRRARLGVDSILISPFIPSCALTELESKYQHISTSYQLHLGLVLSGLAQTQLLSCWSAKSFNSSATWKTAKDRKNKSFRLNLEHETSTSQFCGHLCHQIPGWDICTVVYI